MAIDPTGRACRPAPDNPTAELVIRVHNRSRTVIDAELHRLARRVPALRRADLNVIDAALEELAESLILAPLRNVPQDTAPLLRRLFDTAKVDS